MTAAAQGTLVTGATGFLGHHVLASWAQAPVLPGPLWVLVRDARAWARSPQAACVPQARPIVANLTDVAGIARALDGAPLGQVLHMAAAVHHGRDGAQATHLANVDGTQAMIDLAVAHRARLLAVSTSGTVGCARSAAARPDETAPHCTRLVQDWPYYASKIEAERRIFAAARAQGLRATLVRPPVMLGPGDSRFRATALVLRFLRRKLPFHLSGGMHFIDVRDAAAALRVGLAQTTLAPIYHLPGAQMSLRRFFALLAQVSGVPAPRFGLPHPLAWLLAYGARGRLVDPVLVEMGRHHWGLSSLHAASLGYASRAPEATLRDTVAYLRAAHPELRGPAAASGVA